MDYKAILFEKRNNVAYITLNRPEEANALDLTMAKELHEAALDCDQDENVRAILITAVGRMFCGGGDLKFFNSSSENVEAKLSPPLSSRTAARPGYNKQSSSTLCMFMVGSSRIAV